MSVFIQFLPLIRGQIAVAFSLFPAIFAEKNTSRLGSTFSQVGALKAS